MSKFQQRHYEAIAEVVQQVQADCTPPGAKDHTGRHMSVEQVIAQLIQCLTDEFRAANYQFMPERFRAACEPFANVKARTK